MPELPEVETMRRGIAHLAGRRILTVERQPCRRRPIQIQPAVRQLAARTVGHTIAAVERVGKRVVLRLDDESRIVFEPRMTGLVLLADPPTKEHLRFRMELSGRGQPSLWFWDRRGLGTIRWFAEPDYWAALGPESLGPDALAIRVEQLRLALGSSRRAIKVALLDQRAIAGIGNLYASEILHVAGIHPAQTCQRLRPGQWQAIHQAMQHVLAEAIEYEGSTLEDGTYRNALNQNGSYQNMHRVYARQGDACPSCQSGRVQRIVQAQRTTFFCPRCQRKTTFRKKMVL